MTSHTPEPARSRPNRRALATDGSPSLTATVTNAGSEHQSESPRDFPGEDGGESFDKSLNRHWRRSGLSLTQLARRSWLDISYVSRLVHLPCDPLNPRIGNSGDRRHPSRDTVIRLGLAMQLAMEDVDELLLAAGYAPLVR